MRIQLRKFCDAITPATPSTLEWWCQLPDGATVTLEVVEHPRTGRQNNALHVYFRLLGQALNEAGFDMLSFPWKEGASVPWSQDSVKAQLWHPLQEVVTGEKSTTRLDTKQVNQVYEILARNLAERTGVVVEFPHNEEAA